MGAGFREILNKEKVQEFLDILSQHHAGTYDHSVQVGQMAHEIGVLNSINGEDLEHLTTAAILHDIGKIGIDPSIISKNGDLTPKEKELMREHPKIGYDILEDFHKHIRKPVFGHHVYQKGGYPQTPEDLQNGCGNCKVPILTQIIGAVDKADSLLSPRDYKGPMRPGQVIARLRHDFTGNHQYIDQIVHNYFNSTL
ncbi:HD domain-containing protein [Candidatus Woesearchaeota archaeon]|nr:HD domain-containing protein [Candidatus Woesearchaeota archaeon]